MQQSRKKMKSSILRCEKEWKRMEKSRKECKAMEEVERSDTERERVERSESLHFTHKKNKIEVGRSCTYLIGFGKS